MVNNRDIDKLIVQKVFEMSQAGNSHTEIGDFFHRSRRWAQNILHNYSKETFSPVSVKKRGPQRKTTQEEDQLIIQKAREKAHAPVRAVLGELIWKDCLNEQNPIRHENDPRNRENDAK